MYSERLNKLINQVCHAWEEQAAEHEGKMRALANSIVSEHEAERFNTQKAFKSALAAKNNEINALLSECKKLKALLTHIHGENKELQKKLSMANRTIESLRQGGISYDENGIPTSKQLYLGSNDDSSVFNSDDTLSVGGLGGDYYGNSSGNIGGLDELSISHNQLPPWNQSSSSSSSSSRQQSLQQQQQQSHLFPRGRNSPDVDMYGYNQGGVGGVGGGGGYYPENDPSIRGPPSLTQPHSSSSSSGIGGLFSSSSTTSSSVPSLPSSSSQHFPTRPGPSHGLVYGGRFVLESAGEDPPGLYPRDEYQVDRSSSYDLTRPDRENDEYNQHPQYLDESSSSLSSSSSQIPGQTHAQAQAAAAAAASSKRLSPSAPSFMPGSTGMKNNGSQQQSISVGNSPVTRSNSSGSATLTTPALSSVSLSSSSSILNPNVDFNQNPPPPPGFESFPTSRDPFYEDGQQIISNSNVDPNSNSSLSKIGLEVDPSSSIILNDKDSMDGQLTTSSPLSLQTNEAGTVSVINQMRLQSKSSKLDAKPLISSPTSPISSPPSSHPNINSNNFNTTTSTSSFPSSNLYSEGL